MKNSTQGVSFSARNLKEALPFLKETVK